MKYISGLLYVFLALFSLAFLSGCGLKANSENSNNEGDSEHIEEITENYQTVSDYSDIDLKYFSTVASEKKSFSRTAYHSSDIINCMETGSDGTIFMLVYDEVNKQDFFLRVNDKKEYRCKLEDHYNFILYDEELEIIYAYNVTKSCIEVMDTDFKLMKVLLTDFSPFEIKDMVIYGDALYALIVEENPYDKEEEIQFEDDEYTDYGERMLKINASDGKMSDTGVKGIVTICPSQADYLYLYTHRESGYCLDVYDTKKDDIVYSVKMNEPGYIFSMAIIGSKLYYVSSNSSGLCSLEITTGKIGTEIGDVLTLAQHDFDVHGNCITFLRRNDKEIQTIDTVTGLLTSGGDVIQKKNSECDVVIGLTSITDLPLSVKELSSMTGLSIGTYTSPVLGSADFDEQLTMKLMAEDTDVDIFILYPNDFRYKLANDGTCYPLNNSSVLTNENEKLFNEVGNYLRTPSGEIWGIPIRSWNDLFIVSEKNMKKSGLSESMFEDYDSLFKAFSTINDRKGIFIHSIDLGKNEIINYITNHKPVNFLTGEFIAFFRNMWDGWIMYEEEGTMNNPYFGTEGIRKSCIDGYLSAPDDFVVGMINENILLQNHEKLADLKVYPIPGILREDRSSIMLPLIAIVNPNGENIENALKVMESLAVYIRESGKLGIVFKEVSEYPDSIDTESESFKTLYDINSRAIVADYGITSDILLNEVRRFQKKEIDLDTAIRSIQRKEDAYRNE